MINDKGGTPLKRLFAALLGVLLACGLSTSIRAQSFPDIPPNHWAAADIRLLAERGLVLGYPDGKFLGDRALTRYEMAALIKRVLDEADRRIQAAKARGGETPNVPGATPEDLLALRRLVDEFRPELAVIGADLKRAQEEIAILRADMENLKSTVEGVKANQDLMQQDLDRIKKTTISGYIQARYEEGRILPGTFLLRRNRVTIQHQDGRALFKFQIDAPSNGTVQPRDAYLQYILRPAPNDQTTPLTFQAGQFSVPFGYAIERSSSVREWPERPLWEQVLFPGERDRGVHLFTGFGPRLQADVALVNGTGARSRP
ncbi:MAG: hypothetical protein C4321_07990 [Chloroflexota bacterium]